MSQTTRCPSCATLFKVVADQLRISDGWVRCGHCKQVFDASQSLQTLAAEPLLPDLPFDQLSAPPQPVVRTVAPLQNWGDGYSERRDIVSGAVQASASAAPDAVVPHGLASQASDERVLQVMEPEIPAFLAAADFDRDATDAAVEVASPPSFAWSSVPLPAPRHETADANDQPVLAETDMLDGGSMPAQAGKPAGYELPAAIFLEPDLDWLEDDPEQEQEARAEVAAEAETAPAEPLPQSWDAAVAADDDADVAPNFPQVEGDTTGASDNADSPSPESDAEPEVSEAQPLEEAVPDAVPEPSFVRAARRQALWRKPAVRAVLGVLLIVLTATLLLQVALQQRSYLAAAWPQWRPYLEMACVPLQCRVGAYREISSVVVDSSSFNKLQGNDYQFVITLKNRSGMELEMPAVELTLTDAGDQPVLRRVFTLSDLTGRPLLAARGEWSVTLKMQLASSDSARIASYRVLAFYP